ncbi:hypothetical protein T492DRAFT_1101671 [Pavlovales sp. CCMP2436]|nr:hypothetical protein T492DRAFT_1101671 [Pavlovales sp. CCMP2436]
MALMYVSIGVFYNHYFSSVFSVLFFRTQLCAQSPGAAPTHDFRFVSLLRCSYLITIVTKIIMIDVIF